MCMRECGYLRVRVCLKTPPYSRVHYWQSTALLLYYWSMCASVWRRRHTIGSTTDKAPLYYFTTSLCARLSEDAAMLFVASVEKTGSELLHELYLNIYMCIYIHFEYIYVYIYSCSCSCSYIHEYLFVCVYVCVRERECVCARERERERERWERKRERECCTGTAGEHWGTLL